MIEIELIAHKNVIKETLERIGNKCKNEKIFIPSCYFLKEDDKFFIVHFKEMFILEGKESTYNKLDIIRLKTVVYLLNSWNLVKVKDPYDINSISQKKIDILPKRDKNEWKIHHKWFKKYKYNL